MAQLALVAQQIIGDRFYLGASVSILLLAGIAGTAFTIYYGVFVPWTKTATGRHMFGSGASLAALIDLTLVRYFVGRDFPGLRVLSLVLYALIMLTAWQRLWLLIRLQQGRPHRFLDRLRRRGIGDPGDNVINLTEDTTNTRNAQEEHRDQW